MDGGVERSQLQHLRTGGGDETSIGDAARGVDLRGDAADLFNRITGCRQQFTLCGNKGIARERPVDAVVETMSVEQRLDLFTQTRFSLLGREAEIEIHLQLARDNVVGTGTGMDIGDLKAGGREKLIAPIPLDPRQFRQRWRGFMHRVVRQVGIGHMALHPFYLQATTQ